MTPGGDDRPGKRDRQARARRSSSLFKPSGGVGRARAGVATMGGSQIFCVWSCCVVCACVLFSIFSGRRPAARPWRVKKWPGGSATLRAGAPLWLRRVTAGHVDRRASKIEHGRAGGRGALGKNRRRALRHAGRPVTAHRQRSTAISAHPLKALYNQRHPHQPSCLRARQRLPCGRASAARST